MAKTLEKDIQLTICDYLAIRGHFFWRQNVNPIFNTKSGSYRSMPKYSMNGVSDIILIRPGGIACFLEVKRPGGRQSDGQKIFQHKAEHVGAEYHIVTSLDDIIDLGL